MNLGGLGPDQTTRRLQDSAVPPSHSLPLCAVPSAAPRNLTFDLSERLLSLNWAGLQEDELQGNLLAYKVQWTVGGEAQVSARFPAQVGAWPRLTPSLCSGAAAV